MIKVISFLILAIAALADAEYCDKDTEYISFGGKLPEGRSMGKQILYYFQQRCLTYRTHYKKIKIFLCRRLLRMYEGTLD